MGRELLIDFKRWSSYMNIHAPGRVII